MNISDESIQTLNLTSPADVRVALNGLEMRPLKSLGQNFLIDANILGIILKAADLSSDDHVLEVGAGLGALTEALARVASRVVAVEKDRRLAGFLQARLKPFANIEFICDDILRIDLCQFWSAGINKLVANLPYSIGSAMLMEIFQSDSQPERIVVTLQAEVGRRLVAEPNAKDYGLLSIWSQLSYETEVCKIVSPNCFFPKPEVQSAIVRLTRRRKAGAELADRMFFFRLTKYAFGQRRKQLRRILSSAPPQFRIAPPELPRIFEELKIDPRTRPEALAVEQWVQLSNSLSAKIISL